MGDWNAKVGKRKFEDIVGNYNFGIRNGRATRTLSRKFTDDL